MWARAEGEAVCGGGEAGEGGSRLHPEGGESLSRYLSQTLVSYSPRGLPV
jgi:hypothetical protein